MNSQENRSFGPEDTTVPESKQTPRKKTWFRPWMAIAAAGILILAVVFCILRQQKLERIAAEEAAAQQLALQEQKEQEARQLRYDRIMHSSLYLDGITVEGIDISGMNRPDAQTALQSVLDSHTLPDTLPLSYDGRIWNLDLASSFKCRNDLPEVLDRALKAARDDDMDTAFANADDIAENGRDFSVSFSYTPDQLAQRISEIAGEIDVAAKSAQFINIDKQAHTAETTGSVTGLKVDQEALAQAVISAVEAGSFSAIEIPVTVTEPKVSADNLETMSVTFSTSFKGSNENRCFNINKGVDIINGTILLPGEIFSMNDTLGTRSLSAGWKEANAYVSGGTDLQAGGGVCQISTTLFNAAVMSDLHVVSRQNHSMPVSYIQKGLDATVNSVGFIIDFQFENDTPYDLVIFTWTEGKKLFAKIVRCALETDEYDSITMTSKQVSTLEPDGEVSVTLDETLKPGESVTDVARRSGSVWQSYKNYFKNGTLVKSEPYYRSTYKAFNGSIRVGPALPEASAAPVNPSSDVMDDIPVIG